MSEIKMVDEYPKPAQIVSQKFTKIHMIKMLKCVTGLSLRDAIDITENHLGIENFQFDMSTDDVKKQREKMQDDLLCKMLNNNIKRQLDKEINKLEDELDRLRELRCCEQKKVDWSKW